MQVFFYNYIVWAKLICVCARAHARRGASGGVINQYKLKNKLKKLKFFQVIII